MCFSWQVDCKKINNSCVFGCANNTFNLYYPLVERRPCRASCPGRGSALGLLISPGESRLPHERHEIKWNVRTFTMFAVHFLTTGWRQSLDGGPLNPPLPGWVLIHTEITHAWYHKVIASYGTFRNGYWLSWDAIKSAHWPFKCIHPLTSRFLGFILRHHSWNNKDVLANVHYTAHH